MLSPQYPPNSLDEKSINISFLSQANIPIIEAQVTLSQFIWASHIIHMHNARLLK